ncbi:coiled-coil domain-containing protein 77-like [Oncorhynchus kisutch]|uniref:coiled-coil domain-containing protein 77-like n=1 Tax=Oncorhynchus kisutch TaxID=8019 RepID=UPI0012DFE01B|nr:coiled-coil domain-containing protein 77-like [Oncorhynchus kisutch]
MGSANECFRHLKVVKGVDRVGIPIEYHTEGNQKSRSEGVVNGGSSEQYRSANQTLVLQVLPAQVEEQTGLSKEKVESLLEDGRIHVEEGQVQHQRDQDPITDKLEGTQNLTDESSRDFLKLKFETQARERVEKDRLLRELDTNQDRLREARDSHGREQPGSRGPSSVAQPDTQHVQREELRDRSDKMAKRLQMMTQRYEALKKRAAMEVEGFKSDIKHLKQKLKDVEKQLFKVSMGQMLYACVLSVVCFCVCVCVKGDPERGS